MLYAYDAEGRIVGSVLDSPTWAATKQAMGLNVLESDQSIEINDYFVSGGQLVQKTEADKLPEAITAAKHEWHTTINYFITYKPNGDYRYTGSFKENALNAKIEAVLAGATVPALITTAEAWIQRVKQEYWTVKAQIEAAKTLEALAKIDISYEGLEKRFGVNGSELPDPNVSSNGI